MGVCLSKDKRRITLIMVGLDNAGKTTTARGIVGQPPTDVAPTFGFASFKTKQQNFDVTIYDVGGGKNIRGIWRNYVAESFGFIFVVDSSDTERLQECHDVFHGLVKNPAVSGKPLLILVNKQDVKGALDELEVSHILDVEPIVNEFKCRTRLEMCSAIEGTGKKLDRGISAGFRWLLTTIGQDYDRLYVKVTKDVAIQREQEEIERIQREERIRKLREERDKHQPECDIEEAYPIKEDPFRPLPIVVKEIKDKEYKETSKNDSSPHNTDQRVNNNNGESIKPQRPKPVTDIISDTPFENTRPILETTSTPVYEAFEIMTPPGSVEVRETYKEIISRQNTIDDGDNDVFVTPVTNVDQNGQRKKNLFRRKKRIAPLPPVQNHTMLCDLPPLNPIVVKPQADDANEVQSQENSENGGTINLAPD
ncbi:ADP-ribosylation factor-like protein 13B [Chamberlinius hualienensis]